MNRLDVSSRKSVTQPERINGKLEATIEGQVIYTAATQVDTRQRDHTTKGQVICMDESGCWFQAPAYAAVAKRVDDVVTPFPRGLS